MKVLKEALWGRGPIMNGTAKFFLEILFKYRTNAKRPRSVYSIFHFFACGLFKKSVYLANLLAGRSASWKERLLFDINPENQEPVE